MANSAFRSITDDHGSLSGLTDDDHTQYLLRTQGGGHMKNALINGAFDVWQRGTSFAAAANGQYSADRWAYLVSGTTAVHTLSRSTDVPTVAQAGVLASYSLLVDCTTADGTLGANDQVRIDQRIEGYVWRNFAQRALTLSFWVKATKTGTYCFAMLNGGADRYFVAEYTVNATDTWERKTINIPASPSAGTWDYTTGIGAYAIWTLAAGGDLNDATAGAWATGVEIATANQVNACDDAANNFRIALAQLEVGDTASDFIITPYADELWRCQRYYNTLRYYVDFIATGATEQAFVLSFRPTMRIAPTLTKNTTGSTNVGFFSSTNVGAVTEYAAYLQFAASAPGRMYDFGTFTCEAEL